jgi:hypothetical protein
MSQPLLSILIPTVVGRKESLYVLNKSLMEQILGSDSPLLALATSHGKYGEIGRMDFGEVEILDCMDNKEMTIGEKRERLYQAAKGVFAIQIDDDDALSTDGIAEIIKAIRENPEVDCITFLESVTMNGVRYSSNHSLKYSKWQDNFDGYNFTRTPFYKNVIRTEIAKKVPFPKIRWNEDEQWSYALLSHLKTEHHIDKEIYIYKYDNLNQTHEERYGITQ